MTELTSEFRDIIALYLRLGEELTQILQVDDSQDPNALVQSILQRGDCLAQISQMSSRVKAAADNWKKCRGYLDGKAREETNELAEAAQAQVARLKALCDIHAEKLKIARGRLEKSLAEIHQGSRYLKSLKPVKSNYPKFIDSRH